MPVANMKLESKSHDQADESRTPPKTRLDIVRLGDFSLGRLTLDTGWRWSECVKSVAGTDSCQVTHVGYAVSGKVRIQMNDGTERLISAGESYTIPPGHDAWVEGNELFVGIEIQSAEEFLRAR